MQTVEHIEAAIADVALDPAGAGPDTEATAAGGASEADGGRRITKASNRRVQPPSPPPRPAQLPSFDGTLDPPLLARSQDRKAQRDDEIRRQALEEAANTPSPKLAEDAAMAEVLRATAQVIRQIPSNGDWCEHAHARRLCSAQLRDSQAGSVGWGRFGYL